MRASHVFSVGSSVPETLAPLERIAGNLRWAWHVPSADLFRWIDPALWEETRRNPPAMLARVPAARLNELARDSRFVEQLNKAAADLERHLTAKAHFQLTYPDDDFTVAYFSPEFGVTEALPQYSGGLGVLAGDHIKSASSLGTPIVGVGLYYRDGYFSQSIRADGWQVENYSHDPEMDRLVTNDPAHRFAMPIDGRMLHVAVRVAQVGRIPLLLLDTDLEENEVPLRNVSDRLYGGDLAHRLQQEMLLGIGGVRALELLGYKPLVFHMNEGHAAFLALERIGRFLAAGLTKPEAIEAARATTMFTTHTPVPAGIDRFPRELLQEHLGHYLDSIGLTLDDVIALGAGDAHAEEFNMAHFGLRLAGVANAVARQHEGVSRQLFGELWPALDPSQVPIGHVTNGVHARSWVSVEMDELLSKSLLASWPEADAREYERLLAIGTEDLATVKRAAKLRLIEAVEGRRRSVAPSFVSEAAVVREGALTPDTLIIGFARRFAPYKRATLLMREQERLLKLLHDKDRPVAFLFAGKAHPADDPGKSLIAEIVNFARENGVSERFVFLADYDIALARLLYQGCDVWLNTPRRPLEASGTSGMKAAMNGTLNCSILDGWWAECFDGQNGFTPTSAPEGLSPEEVDAFEAASLMATLEEQVVPLYFAKDSFGLRGPWYEMVRYSMSNLVPYVSGARMVKQYTEQFYVPSARRAKALFGDDYAGLRELTAWKQRVCSCWGDVHIYSFEVDVVPSPAGEEAPRGQSYETRRLHVEVSAAGLGVGDLAVEALYGPVRPGTNEFASFEVAPASYNGSYRAEPEFETGGGAEGREVHLYTVEFVCKVGGTFGYLIQIYPHHPLVGNDFELGLRIHT
ncbi:MAG: alpha-glucan family phosphorylase [Actinomycetota bacterium]|nr:alpha-glucan family phosphorylase [Actinomycetota bacterium]